METSLIQRAPAARNEAVATHLGHLGVHLDLHDDHILAGEVVQDLETRNFKIAIIIKIDRIIKGSSVIELNGIPLSTLKLKGKRNSFR